MYKICIWFLTCTRTHIHIYINISIYIYRVSHKKLDGSSLHVLGPFFNRFDRLKWLTTSTWSQLSHATFKSVLSQIVFSLWSFKVNKMKIHIVKNWKILNFLLCLLILLSKLWKSRYSHFKSVILFSIDIAFRNMAKILPSIIRFWVTSPESQHLVCF